MIVTSRLAGLPAPTGPAAAPPAPPSAPADRFERRQHRLEAICSALTDLEEPVGDILPWLGGIAMGALGLDTGGIVSGITGALVGSVPFVLLGACLGGAERMLEGRARDYRNLSRMASHAIPSMDDASIPAADGSRLSLGIAGYQGMGSALDLHVQYFKPGAAAPAVDFLTSRAFIDDQVGELHACGRTLDGKKYHVVAAFPQSGLESFSFEHPVAARLAGPGLRQDFADPSPAPPVMQLPGA